MKKLALLVLTLMTLMGCQGWQATDVVWMDDGSKHQTAQYRDINLFGHDTTIGIVHSWAPDGAPTKKYVASGVSNSFFNEWAPAAVHAAGYYAGQEARDANNVNVTSGNSSSNSDSDSKSNVEIGNVGSSD